MWSNCATVKSRRPRVIAVSRRCGPLTAARLHPPPPSSTKSFRVFPYEEAFDQSFSLMFESPSGPWSTLASANFICSSGEEYALWRQALGTLLRDISDNRVYYDSFDVRLRWLRQHFARRNKNNQIRPRDVYEIMRSVHRGVRRELVNQVYAEVTHALAHTPRAMGPMSWRQLVHFWYCFIPRPEIQDLYKRYAHEPSAGMRPQELVDFLRIEQQDAAADLNVAMSIIMKHEQDQVFLSGARSRRRPRPAACRSLSGVWARRRRRRRSDALEPARLYELPHERRQLTAEPGT